MTNQTAQQIIDEVKQIPDFQSMFYPHLSKEENNKEVRVLNFSLPTSPYTYISIKYISTGNEGVQKIVPYGETLKNSIK